MSCMRIIGTTSRQGLTWTLNILEDVPPHVPPHGIELDQNLYRAERSKYILDGPP